MAWHRADAQQHGQRLQGPGRRCRFGWQHAFGVAVRIGTVGQAELQHLTGPKPVDLSDDFLGIWENGWFFKHFVWGFLEPNHGYGDVEPAMELH